MAPTSIYSISNELLDFMFDIFTTDRQEFQGFNHGSCLPTHLSEETETESSLFQLDLRYHTIIIRLQLWFLVFLH